MPILMKFLRFMQRVPFASNEFYGALRPPGQQSGPGSAVQAWSVAFRSDPRRAVVHFPAPSTVCERAPTMLQLYYFPGNANLAPHMLLEEIGVPYQLVPVDRANNAQKSPEYLKMNPSGRIPVLVDGDLVLFETAAICLHLADRHPASKLAPALGTSERAEFYKWLMYLTNTLQAELMLYFYPERLTDDAAAAAQVKKHAEARISGEGGMLDILEAQLAKSGGPWVLGAHYTALDPYLMLMARWTRGMANPARNRTLLGRFLHAMAARPAVQRAFEQEGLQPPLF